LRDSSGRRPLEPTAARPIAKRQGEIGSGRLHRCKQSFDEFGIAFLLTRQADLAPHACQELSIETPTLPARRTAKRRVIGAVYLAQVLPLRRPASPPGWARKLALFKKALA
jgi:hypothetical protein